MIVCVVSEQRFSRTPDGAFWSSSGPAGSFFRRYLDVFDQVHIVARVGEVPSVPGSFRRTDGEGVTFLPVPCYVGPWQYVRSMRQVGRASHSALRSTAAVIVRAPSVLGNRIVPAMWRQRRPYGVEVVGDPYDVFAPGTLGHPLRPFFRWWFCRSLRKQCASASGCAYVTRAALQRRYPARPTALATHYSSIELPAEWIASAPRRFLAEASAIRAVFVGSLSQLYKGPDVLVEAAARCLAAGVDLQLVFIGDGRFRHGLEAQAARSGLATRTTFLGEIPGGSAVYAELDRADLFVLPARTEGLPRALIEAMARGLPCIASAVGGIPELLPPEDLVAPGDVGELATKIREVAADPSRLNQMSQRNLQRAHGFAEERLRARRIAFYRHIREATEAWQTREKRA